jgi:thiol:disulfide interchange protein
MKLSRFIPVTFLLLTVLVSGSFAQEAAKWSAKTDKSVVKQGETFRILVHAKMNDKWHVYSATPMEDGPVETSFDAHEGSSYVLKGKVKQPKPTIQYDEAFDIDTEYFEHEVTFTLTAVLAADAKPGSKKQNVDVTFMACNDRMCLPPSTIEVPFTLTVEGSEETASDDEGQDEDGIGSAAMTEIETDDDTSDAIITSGADDAEGKTLYGDERDIERARKEGFWAYIGLAMSVGALALLTPCVFPMIPITVSFFTKREAATRGRSIRDASIYSIGIMFTFTGLGILLAVLFGAAGINQFAANPWMNILIAAVFIIFALNLFGMFEIVVPSGILNKLNTKSNQGTGVVSILLMALTFTLTSFTCTVPFVGTVMVAAASGEIWWSVAGMLAFSAVFALPFFLLALFPSWLKSMPKSGGWLNSVKVVMGFLEIAAAMKFLSNVDLIWGLGLLNRDLFLAFWVGIGVIVTMYILGKIQLPHDTVLEKLGAIRVLFAVFFLGISVYIYTGLGDKPLGELDAFLPPMDYETTIQAAGGATSAVMPGGGEKEVWLDSYETALQVAKAENKPIFIDFTGFACTNCRWMESNVFTKRQVKALLKDFVLVKLYTDGQGEMYDRNRDFQQDRFGTVALPLYVVMNAENKEVNRFPGMTRETQEFVDFLEAGKQSNVVAAGI